VYNNLGGIMAFPGTYNINYYRGDTLEFRIYPKDANGNTFSLSGYGTAKFWIQTQRGNAGYSSRIEGVATISSDYSYVQCAIAPTTSGGLALVAGTTYVYDVEVSKTVSGSYNQVHTLLTGTITVTDHVSGTVAP
jgi:hypothetical protein